MLNKIFAKINEIQEKSKAKENCFELPNYSVDDVEQFAILYITLKLVLQHTVLFFLPV